MGQRTMNANFIIYLIGYAIVVAGVAFGMDAAGLDAAWITPVVLVLIGLGIVYAMSRSEQDVAARGQGASRTHTAGRTDGMRGERVDEGSHAAGERRRLENGATATGPSSTSATSERYTPPPPHERH